MSEQQQPKTEAKPAGNQRYQIVENALPPPVIIAPVHNDQVVHSQTFAGYDNYAIPQSAAAGDASKIQGIASPQNNSEVYSQQPMYPQQTYYPQQQVYQNVQNPYPPQQPFMPQQQDYTNPYGYQQWPGMPQQSYSNLPPSSLPQQPQSNVNQPAVDYEGFQELLPNGIVVLIRSVASGKYVQITEKGNVNALGDAVGDFSRFRVIRVAGAALCKFQNVHDNTRWLKLREGGLSCCEVSQHGTPETEMHISHIMADQYNISSHQRKNHFLGFNKKGEGYPVYDPTSMFQKKKSLFEIIPLK